MTAGKSIFNDDVCCLLSSARVMLNSTGGLTLSDLTADLDASNVELDGRPDSSDLTVDLDASNVELDSTRNFDEPESVDPYVIVLTF